MKAKTFIQNLSQCIFEECKKEIPREELKSSLVEAIKNLSAGKLQDELNSDFDKNLNKLEKRLKNLRVRELPSIGSPVDDSLEELTKSELDGRTDVSEDDGTKQEHKMIYNLMDRKLKKPKLSTMKALDDTQRYLIYRTLLQKVLNREDATDKFIRTVIQDFDDLCEISQNEEDGKFKFDWFPMCNLLLELVTGSKPLAFIRVLKVLFESVQNDVNKCLAKGKIVRSGKLANILKKFITNSHLKIDKAKLKDSERKMYCRYVSALLSFFVDLCCIHSSKVAQKKLFGREIAGYVCYILQPWPESLLEVALQLQGLEENYYFILSPLITKCMEVKPQGTDHVYYLKYVLLVRQVKDAYGEYEQIQEWNFATKNIPAKTGFLDWLSEECPDALEYVPVEDRKFKKTKITRFLLEEAEDDLIAILLNSLSKENEGKTDDVPVTLEDAEETGVTMATEPVYYLDKAGGSSILELADGQVTEEPKSRIPSKNSSDKGTAKESRSKRKSIVLKTVEEVEKLVDTAVLEDGIDSPQTYTLDPKFVMEKVKDPEDRKFLQSEIISITSMSSISEGEEIVERERSEDTLKADESKISNSSDKSAKWTKSNSSTPNKEPKQKRRGKNSRKNETDDSDISVIEKTEGFYGSVTSASEDDHKVKSVVRKVTPRKLKANSMKSPGKDEDVSSLDIKKLQDTKTETRSREKVTASKTEGVANESKTEIEDMENVISIDDSDDELETKDVDSKDGETDNTNEIFNEDEELSPVHESSVEIVDIVLEPDEHSNTSNMKEGESISEERTDKKRKSLSKLGSPNKLQKSASPRKQLSGKSPVPVNTSKTEESVVTEDSLSCMSGLSTATNYSETVEITTDTSEMHQNTTGEESQMDNTAMYIGGKCRGSSYKSASESESDTSRNKSRKASKKYLPSEKEDLKASVSEKDDADESVGKSMKKSHKRNNVSEIHAEDESDGDVFKQTPEKNSKTKVKYTKSVEEKFIGKAIKGKKTPKKSSGKSEMHGDQEVSGSVSLFPDADDIKGVDEDTEDGDPGKRTKSTEEIFQIVEEIKEKIRTPSTRKSVSKGKEKLNNSMFTDDSVESLGNEGDILSEELKSPEKKRKLHSDLSDKSSPRKMKSNEINEPEKFESLTQEKKIPSKVHSAENKNEIEIIDVSDDENDQQYSAEKTEKGVVEAETSGNTDLSEKSTISPTKNEKDKSKTSDKLENSISTPSPAKKSPLKMKKRTPHKTKSDDDASKLRSPNETVKSDSETAAKSSPEVSKETKNEKDKSKTSDKLENSISTPSPAKKSPLIMKKRTPHKTKSDDDASKLRSPNETVKSDSETAAKSSPEVSKETKNEKDKSKTSDNLENIISTPSPAKKIPLKMKERTPHKTKSDDDASKLRSPNETVKSDSETAAKSSPEVSKDTNRSAKTKISGKGTPNKQTVTPNKDAGGSTNKSSIKSPESKNASEEKFDTVSDSETDSEISDMTNRTPKEKLDATKSRDVKSKTKSPQSAKGNISGKKENVKTPEKKTDKIATPKSGSMKSPETVENTSLVTTPVSNKKKKSMAAEIESASKKKSPATKRTMEEKPTDSGDDFVPSSQKKSRTKTAIKDSNKKKEAGIPSSSIESDEDLTLIPDIGAHLKPESTKPRAVDSKSPHIPSSLDTKTSQKKQNESTPQKGRRQSNRITASLDQSTEPEKDASTKKRVSRTRQVSETVVDSEEESDVDGPTHPKRLRSATKTVPETVKSGAAKERIAKTKSDLKKVYEFNSETDVTTDQSDTETRQTRRSKGGQRLTAIRDKIPESVEEEPVNLLRTPPGKLTRQRKGSASTTKKNVKKVEELRGTRKRRLSGQLESESSPGNISTDSEVLFPKVKSVAGAGKKSKRLSAPAVPASKEQATDASGRRYSLRKK